MIDQFKQMMQDASDVVRQQVQNVGNNAKEKAYDLIEEWLKILPILEAERLDMNSFSLSVAINPALEVELVGKNEDFTIERLDRLRQKYKGKLPLQAVFSTIRTTYIMHSKINAPLKNPLIVKIKVRLTPEINVFIGEPLIL
ncbi:MAG: hypothetical protein AAGI23_15575 [Bacteroidota bacterium]